MSQRLLFSPVGGTDPISWTNARDGSMLHICRVEQPDVVYLYMSSEILHFEETDHRYTYCLDKLGEKLHHPFDYRIIRRPELKNVEDFDFFYDEFSEILRGIEDNMSAEDELLLNVSSGTPAMKSSLLVMATLMEVPCRTIQVVTPERRMNEHVHKGYDVELAWEADEDNAEEFENRCIEVHCPALMEIKQKEIIKKLVLEYDYEAAYAVAVSLPGHAREAYLPLLDMARARMLLQCVKVNQIAIQQRADCIPIRDGSLKEKYFEYALNVDLKIRKKEYADFVRSITPLIVDLFEEVIRNVYRININDYCMTDRNGIRKWNRGRLAGSKLLACLDDKYGGGGSFNYGPVYSDHLLAVINGYPMTDKPAGMVELANRLRDIEQSIRNQAAHEIVSITNEKIQHDTGYTAEEIMKLIRRFFRYTGIQLKEEDWNSYERMNALIIQAI